MSRKIVSKSLADGLVQLAILNVYMRRINYDSATVDIPFLLNKETSHFRMIFHYKTMRLGDLSWENLKNRENHELGPAWESQSNAIADLFVMFIAWTSQKASKVHRLLSQSWP